MYFCEVTVQYVNPKKKQPKTIPTYWNLMIMYFVDVPNQNWLIGYLPFGFKLLEKLQHVRLFYFL